MRKKNIKKIVINSHKNDLVDDKTTIKYKDIYDSKIELYNSNNELLFESNYFNVDSSNKYLKNQGKNNRKIEIMNGKYFGICCNMSSGKKAILIFKYDPIVANNLTSKKQLYNNHRELLDLPTTKANPLHNNAKYANFIYIHDGGENYDWSAGCLTILKKDYKEFIDKFNINEVLIVEKN